MKVSKVIRVVGIALSIALGLRLAYVNAPFLDALSAIAVWALFVAAVGTYAEIKENAK